MLEYWCKISFDKSFEYSVICPCKDRNKQVKVSNRLSNKVPIYQTISLSTFTLLSFCISFSSKELFWIHYDIEYCKRPLSKEKRMMTLLINERDRVVWNSSVKWMAVLKVWSYNNHISHSFEIFQFRTIFILYCFYTLIIISSYYSI